MSKKLHGEGSVTQRSDGTWTARIQIGFNENGKPKIKAFYGKTRREVTNKLNNYKLLRKTGDDVDLPDFDTYISNWLNDVKINELKPLSFDRLESTIDNHIIPAIGHLKTNNINDNIIQSELINKKTTIMAYSSIKKIYDAMNACFKYAVARRDLRYNPMATVSIPSKVTFENKGIEIFTDEEVETIVKVANSKYSN